MRACARETPQAFYPAKFFTLTTLTTLTRVVMGDHPDHIDYQEMKWT
jgi:hypothetical protein